MSKHHTLSFIEIIFGNKVMCVFFSRPLLQPSNPHCTADSPHQHVAKIWPRPYHVHSNSSSHEPNFGDVKHPDH